MVRGKSYRSPLVDKIQKPVREAATTCRVVPFQKYFLEHCKYVLYISVSNWTGQDKGTEVPSLSQDKGTMRQAQNLAKGRDGPRQPVKIWDETQNRTVRDFDSRPIPSRPAEGKGTEQRRTF